MVSQWGVRRALVVALVVLLAVQTTAAATPMPDGASNAPVPDPLAGAAPSGSAPTASAPTDSTTPRLGPTNPANPGTAGRAGAGNDSDANGTSSGNGGAGPSNSSAPGGSGDSSAGGANGNGDGASPGKNDGNGDNGKNGNGGPPAETGAPSDAVPGHGQNATPETNPSGLPGFDRERGPSSAGVARGPPVEQGRGTAVTVGITRSAPPGAGAADNGAPDTTPGERNGSTPAGARPAVASVSVQHAPANTPLDLGVSVGSPKGGVGVDQLSMSVASRSNYTLEVAANDTPFATTPDFDTGTGASALGFVRVDHSIEDPEIENVTFTFRVAKDRVSHEALDDITLYRHHAGDWTALETTVVRETADAYVFRATSPGLSEFVVGKERAVFSVRSIDIGTTSVASGDRIVARVLVTNTGEADGTFAAALGLDGTTVDRSSMTIAAHGTRQLTLTHVVVTAGTYLVSVSNEASGTIASERVETDTTTTPRTVSSVQTRESGVGIGVAFVIALVFLGVGRY